MERPGAWLETLPALCSSLLGENGDPLTLLLGAGASRSSGCPSTADVVAAIRAAYPTHFESDAAVFAELVEIQENEKRRPIESRFRERQPYVGYHMLAAIARARPVTVVNLNWDDCVEHACQARGVRCWPFDIADPVEKIRQALHERDRAGAGVVCIHVHGRLRKEGERDAAHPLRFGTLETLRFERQEQVDLLRECFDAATLVAGASLRQDRERDTTELLDALRGSGDGSKAGPIWVAVREEDDGGPAPIIHAVLRARRGDKNAGCRGPDLDFDRLLWALRAADAGYEWSELRGEEGSNLLPEPCEMILPRPELLRPHLEDPPPVLVLPGRARQGKTTVAHIVAHWLSLFAADAPRVCTFRRNGCVDGLSEAEPGAVVVLDDPFGEVDYRPAPAVYEGLQRLTPGTGNVVVATRFESLRSAAAEPGADELLASSSAPSDWWGQGALELYAEQLRPGASALVRANPTELSTPFKVRRAARAEEGEQLAPDDPAEITQWLCSELKHGAPEAKLRVLVRLQDFHEPIQADELQKAIGLEPQADPPSELGGSLRLLTVDHEYFKLSSEEDVRGVDGVIERHRELVESALAPLAPKLPWIFDSLDAWDAVIGATGAGPPDAIVDRVLFGWTFELARRAASRSPADAWTLLEAARERAPDTWAMREVVFAAVFLWRTIESDERAPGFIENVLDDPQGRRGTYALLEALLRLQANPPVELVARAIVGIKDLTRRDGSEHELLLIFDGLLWKPLQVADNTKREVFKWLLGRAKRSAGMRAAFAAVAAYHRAGAQFVLDDPTLPNPLHWASHAQDDPELVSWFVKWHVAHQARITAVMTRESFRAADEAELKRIQRTRLCLDRLDDDQARAFAELIAGLLGSEQHAGWGVHFALNVNNTTGELDTQPSAERVSDMRENDVGLATCAFYAVPDELWYGLRDYLRGRGRRGLLRVLGTGFEFEEVEIEAPRFRLGADGWDLRYRWSTPDKGLAEALGVSLDDPRAFLEALEEHREEAIENGADQAGLDKLLLLTDRGDTEALEDVVSGTLMPARAGDSHPDDPSPITFALTEASLNLVKDESR